MLTSCPSDASVFWLREVALNLLAQQQGPWTPLFLPPRPAGARSPPRRRFGNGCETEMVCQTLQLPHLDQKSSGHPPFGNTLDRAETRKIQMRGRSKMTPRRASSFSGATSCQAKDIEPFAECERQVFDCWWACRHASLHPRLFFLRASEVFVHELCARMPFALRVFSRSSVCLSDGAPSGSAQWLPIIPRPGRRRLPPTGCATRWFIGCRSTWPRAKSTSDFSGARRSIG